MDPQLVNKYGHYVDYYLAKHHSAGKPMVGVALNEIRSENSGISTVGSKVDYMWSVDLMICTRASFAMVGLYFM